MKISEQQIHKMLHYLYICLSDFTILNENGKENLGNLLREITNQQSTELREVE